MRILGRLMRVKILLVGRNEDRKTELFYDLNDTYEVMTSGVIYEDVFLHINSFHPDMVLLSLDFLHSEEYQNMVDIRNVALKPDGIPLAVIGTTEETDAYKKATMGASELTLNGAFPAFAIKSQIDMFLKKIVGDKATTMISTSTKKGRKRVLVIDDSSLMLKIIREELRDSYDVTLVTSGNLALEYLESKTTDIILLDYDMPVKNGIEVLEELRGNPKTKSIPVIFLTGVTDRQKITKALKMSPQGYLLKPIDKDKLLEMIKKFIG